MGVVMLVISELKKKYPNDVLALKAVTLTIGRGVFGLLGPNGAGKSTLMRIIATLQQPDSGSVIFEGIDVLKEPEQIRAMLGYLPQEFGLYPSITATEMLEHLAILKGIHHGRERREQVAHLLETTGLTEHRGKKLGEFSGGMKRRFGIAQALLGNPKLLIVDEPTAGLDPAEKDRLYHLLSLVGENATVILSTHIISDITALCNDMAIIQNGQILMQKSPQESIRGLSGRIGKAYLSREEMSKLGCDIRVLSTRLCHGKFMLKIFEDASFEKVEPDLEDVYFSYVKGFVGVS